MVYDPLLPFASAKGLILPRPDGRSWYATHLFSTLIFKGLLHHRKNYLVICLALLGLTAYAQCPSSITATSADVTAASCPSSGQILVHSSAESEPSATYQIISGPATGGYQTTAQSSNNFTGLPAGSYTIRITCGSVTADVTASVADTYTPIGLTPTVTNVCSTSSGSAIITATATGGKAPLTYAFLLSGNAAEPDANFTYSTSNTFNAPSFGVYQVRVKDACNNFVTQSVDVQPIYPEAKLFLDYQYFTCSTAFITAYLKRSSDNTAISPSNSGYTVDIWYVSSTDPCTVPTSASPDKSFIVNSSADLNLQIPTTAQNMLVRTTSICGQQTIECLPLQKFDVKSYAAVHVGCTVADNVNLALNIYDGAAPYNVSVQGYDANGNPVPGTNQSFVYNSTTIYSFPTAHHYIYTVTDGCGDNLTKTVTTPVPSSGTQLAYYNTDINCVNAAGTVNLSVQVVGFVPSQDVSQMKLVNAATNAFVANAAYYNVSNGSMHFRQIPPGAYKIVFTPTDPACPPTEVPANIPASTQGLVFDLDGSTTQLCGGAGTITANLDFNGVQPVSFQLLQGTTVIASNVSGSFTNMAPGTYILKAIVNLSGCGKPNMEATKELTIQPEGSLPVVVKKLGINCTATAATGIAVFEFSGFGPFLLEMKKVTETTYTVISSAVPNNYTAGGLSADTDYDVRITDQCGKTSVTQVSVKPLVAVYVTNSAQPCLDQAYTLSVEEIPNAAYSWTFNGGPVIATSKDIVFGSYTPASNGSYQCIITLGDCITKVVTVNLNSINCSQPLAKSGLGDYVWNDTNNSGIQEASEMGVSGITVTLFAADGVTSLATTTTDISGFYSFPNLTAGSYVVGFSGLPSGYLFSSANGTLNDAGNSDANANGKTVVITLADNEFNMNVDAGIYYSLPVTLISFNAKALDNGVLLNWSTATETNSDRFEIERSMNGKTWSSIGTVRSHGESSTLKKYDFTDAAPFDGDNFYRLRMVDSDLTFAFSRIQHVSFSAGKQVTVFPNPVTDMLYVKGLDQGKIKELSILNAKGDRVFRSTRSVAQGVNVSQLPAGIYTVSVKRIDGKIQAFKVMVAK